MEIRTARLGDVLLPLAAVVGILLIWQVATVILAIPSWQLPSPSAIAGSLVDHAPLLFANAVYTVGAVLVGFALSVLIGVPLAIALSFSRVFSKMFYPLVVASNSLPKSAFAPLLLVWFGFGITIEVVIAFLICFFPVVVNTSLGLLAMPVQLHYLALSMGADRRRTFWKVRVPYALPYIFGGLKVAISLAVVGAIVGEFVASNQGLGYVMLAAGGNFDTALVFAALLVLGVVAWLLFAVVQLAERLVLPQTRLTAA